MPQATIPQAHKDPVVTAKQNPIDRRPFRSKAEHLLDKHLEAQYRGLAIPEIVAALATGKELSEQSRPASLAPAR